MLLYCQKIKVFTILYLNYEESMIELRGLLAVNTKAAWAKSQAFQIVSNLNL